MRQRFLRLRFPLLLIFPLILACAGNETGNLSPKGKLAYTATKVVKGLDVLRDVASEGNQLSPPVISDRTLEAIVVYHKSAVQTINSVPSGWKPIVLTGLDQLQGKISEAELKQITPYINLVRTLLQEVQ